MEEPTNPELPTPQKRLEELIDEWRNEKKLLEAKRQIILKCWPVLIRALQDGNTRGNAIRLAGMGSVTFYNHLNSIPEFRAIVEEAEAYAVDQAVQSIKGNLDDPKVAMWFLERKEKEWQAPSRLDVTSGDNAIIFSFNLKELPQDESEEG